MLRYVIIAAITLNAVLGDENSNDHFNFKLTKDSADMALKMKDTLKHTIVGAAKSMEGRCKYVEAMKQYGLIIELARLFGCSVEKDITQLDTYKITYKTSLISCFEELNSTDTFDKIIDDVVVQIQTIDQNAKSEADACSGDEECEKQVYADTHKTITDLYENHIAEVKVAEDQALTDALSGIVQCMIPKVSDSLKEIYGAIWTLQTCIGDRSKAESIASEKPNSK